MNKKTLLKISWTFFVLGFITSVLLIIISFKNDNIINAVGPIIFFSTMFLGGFIGLNIQYKEK